MNSEYQKFLNDQFDAKVKVFIVWAQEKHPHLLPEEVDFKDPNLYMNRHIRKAYMTLPEGLKWQVSDYEPKDTSKDITPEVSLIGNNLAEAVAIQAKKLIEEGLNAPGGANVSAALANVLNFRQRLTDTDPKFNNQPIKPR